MKTRALFTWLVALVLALVLFNCNSRPQTNVTVTAAPVSVVSPQDFDLQTVIGLLRTGVADGPSLEASINSPTSGINNVDVDKDGQVDYVQVVETPVPAGKEMDLVAKASGHAVPDVNIASITFNQEGPTVNVQAGYSSAIDPTGSMYYHDTLASDLLLAQWLFMPSRPVFIARPITPGYVYRPRVAPSVVAQTRSTFTSTTRVNPVPVQPRPSSFSAGRSSPTPAAAPRQPATTLGGASQGVSNFNVDNRSKPAGVGFGSSPAPRAAPAPAPVSRPSTPAPSRPSSSLSSGRRR